MPITRSAKIKLFSQEDSRIGVAMAGDNKLFENRTLNGEVVVPSAGLDRKNIRGTVGHGTSTSINTGVQRVQHISPKVKMKRSRLNIVTMRRLFVMRSRNPMLEAGTVGHFCGQFIK